MINFMIENLDRILELKEQGQTTKATIETLKNEIPGMPVIKLETFTQYRRVLEAYHVAIVNKVERLTIENSNLRKELEIANAAIANVSQLEVKENNSIKIAGWNVTIFRGYHRGFKRIGGKLRSVYLGKDLTGAAEKVAAKELTFTESGIDPQSS
ncbi:MAG: hypothetical protein WCR46_07170 [Deltaproteobacteria bacterium]